MPKEIIVVFDIGKTNKKILCFDKNLEIVHQYEQKFPEITDDDGFACDDIEKLESFLFSSLEEIETKGEFDIKAINFSTYGATLMYLDKEGERLTPIYNYLKPMPEGIAEKIYNDFGGVDEFSRKTASPALGMLNSGLQLAWLKQEKPEVTAKMATAMHFPQYVSYLFTKKITSEYTSIGCHTAMWDFDNKCYHPWLAQEGFKLPTPIANDTTYPSTNLKQNVPVGIGIHDSSGSLVPYLKGSDDKFILISTGTWCINMNPFNDEPLTADQLKKDSLCFLSINQEQVKSSRLFMGFIHEVNAIKMAKHFGTPEDHFKTVKADDALIEKCSGKQVYFNNELPESYIDETVDLSQFESYEEAYHQMMIDLTKMCIDSLGLIIPVKDETKKVYISGGFARNEIFVRLLATYFKDKEVLTSQVDNASALGAALVVWDHLDANMPQLDLGLKAWAPLNFAIEA